jgi:S-adenosylmethionine synthetase
LRPIYRATTNYGHFGKKGLPWEETNKVAALLAAVK